MTDDPEPLPGEAPATIAVTQQTQHPAPIAPSTCCTQHPASSPPSTCFGCCAPPHCGFAALLDLKARPCGPVGYSSNGTPICSSTPNSLCFRLSSASSQRLMHLCQRCCSCWCTGVEPCAASMEHAHMVIMQHDVVPITAQCATTALCNSQSTTGSNSCRPIHDKCDRITGNAADSTCKQAYVFETALTGVPHRKGS